MELKDIRRVRKRLGLTQAGLAKESGVSQSLIAKIESNKMDPTYSNAKKIFITLNGLSNKSELKAKDILQSKIISVNPDSDIKKAIMLMKKHNISQMPVLKENQPIGMISEAIILEAIMENKTGFVCDIMTDSPPIISNSTNLTAISGLLKFFPMVLVSKNGKIKGVITKSDLIEKLN